MCNCYISTINNAYNYEVIMGYYDVEMVSHRGMMREKNVGVSCRCLGK